MHLRSKIFGLRLQDVSVHCKKRHSDRLTKVFLLHKDKKGNGNPPHIQAHLSLPDTKANASQSQKSLHFADPHSTLLISL